MVNVLFIHSCYAIKRQNNSLAWNKQSPLGGICSLQRSCRTIPNPS